MKASVWLTLVALLSSGAVDCAAQSPASYRGALTVTVENDVATGSDNNYTNGVGVTWVSNAIDTYEKESLVRRWGEFWSFLPFVGNEGYRTYVSWSLAQEMHTPDDITSLEPATGRPALCRRAVPRQYDLCEKGTLGTCVAAQSRRSRPRIAG